MNLPNEIINIIFSFKESPLSNKLFKEILLSYNSFINGQTYCNSQSYCKSTFYIYFFRLWLPIWKRWPENYPKLLAMK
jgi:hypothetical protein